MDEVSNLNPHSLLQNYLINSEEYENFKLAGFPTSNSFKNYFERFWEREDLIGVITSKIPNNYPDKDNKAFKYLFLEGMNLSKKGQLPEALLKYNNAILFAPHSKDASRSSVALLYNVRSVLLKEMGRFAESVNDIDRAFQHGCFKKDQEKSMYHTKIECLIKLNRRSDAENLINQLYEEAKQASDSNWLNILQSFQDRCNVIKMTNVTEGSSMPVSLDHYSEVPSIFENCESEDDTNIINESIRVNFSEAQATGRHFIANRDINPGELLMTDNAISSIPRLTMETLSLYCCVCLRRVKIALPCDHCSLVSFCSTECISSRSNNHKMECSIFFIFLETKVDYELALVFRTLLKFPMEEILSEFENNKILNNNYTPGLEHAKAFVESPITYSSLTKMIGNWDKRNGDYCLQMAANAVLGVTLLQRVSTFWERKDETSPPIEQNFETLTILGGEIIKLQLNFQCNTYYIKELQIDKNKNIINLESCYSGYGIYKSFSLLNHSCLPNSFFSSYKDMLYLHSINFIPKGHEVLVDYGVRYAHFDLLFREIHLYTSYCMECKCEACSKNWPVYVDLPNDYDLKCPSCSQAVKKDSKFCTSCFSEKTVKEMSTEERNLNDLSQITNRLQKASEKYYNSIEEFEQRKTTPESIKNIKNYIFVLQRNTILPHKIIVLAEVMLQRCFEMIGNKHYIDTN